MANIYNIAIIGAGNLAWHLAPELENAGHHIVEIYSPTPKNAKAFQNRLYHAEINTSLDFSDSKANIFIICVTDDVIEEVAQEISLPVNAIIIHTSGSQPINKLAYTTSKNIGVIYPLQTFSKRKRVSFEDIPMLIEAENSFTAETLKELAKSISKNVKSVSSSDRMAIHIAAVFACNFTNHLFEIADKLLVKQGFDFDLLRPLIAETINKSLDIGPASAQTGPAARGDLEVLDKHMDFLEGREYQDIYKIVTDAILNNRK